MRILLTSIPKSGTHLAQHMLCLGGYFIPHYATVESINIEWLDPEKFAVTGHVVPHPTILREVKMEAWKVIFLHREPRDLLVSMKYHCEDRDVIWSPYCGWEKSDYDHSDGLLWLIENVKPWYDHMMEWVNHATYVMTYEQLKTAPIHPNVERIAKALYLDVDGVIQRSKDKVTRYRTGKSNNWQGEFKPHHIERYNEIWAT